MTPSELRQLVETRGGEVFFFDRKTMRFFGDTMRNYGVQLAQIRMQGRVVGAWELFRRRPVKHNLHTSAYFDPISFRQVWPDEQEER